MLLTKEDSERRLRNPLNLMNRSRAEKFVPAMSLFKKREREREFSKETQPSEPTTEKPSELAVVEIPAIVAPASLTPAPELTPTTDDLINDIDNKIGLVEAHNKGLKLINKAMSRLEENVESIRLDKLPGVIVNVGKVIGDIRREQVERQKDEATENVHYHFYCPTQRKVNEYEVIDVK